MSSTQQHPGTPTAEASGETAYYKAILHELVDMAADLARIAHHQAKRQAARDDEAATAAVPPIPAANDRVPDPTIAFDRIARTIRRTIALAQHLDQPPKPPGAATPYRIAARKRILRRVEDVIHRRAKPGEATPLRTELRERLDAPDLEDDLATIPLDDIIEDILRDLHLAHAPEAWKRRTPQDVGTLSTQAAAIPQTWKPADLPGPPFARGRQPPPPKRRYNIQT